MYLPAGQVERSARCRLAAHVGQLAKNRHGDVAFTNGGDSRVEHLLRFLLGLGRLGLDLRRRGFGEELLLGLLGLRLSAPDGLEGAAQLLGRDVRDFQRWLFAGPADRGARPGWELKAPTGRMEDRGWRIEDGLGGAGGFSAAVIAHLGALSFGWLIALVAERSQAKRLNLLGFSCGSPLLAEALVQLARLWANEPPWE